MPEYTAADFAAARFAEHPSTEFLAMRSRPVSACFPWETSDGYETDEQMAATGWRPVREAAPLSLDALREAWEAAEVITPDSPTRKGDEVIEELGAGYLRVFKARWDGDTFSDCGRILRRGQRRPEGPRNCKRCCPTSPSTTQTARNIRSGLRTCWLSAACGW